MARPVDEKEDKDNKKGFELNQTSLMIINNIIIIVVIISSLVAMYFLLDYSMNKKLEKYLPQEEQLDEESDGETQQEGLLVDLGDFVLNLADVSPKRYLKVDVAMELSKTQEEIEPDKETKNISKKDEAEQSQQIVSSMERYKPAIRDAVISVLSNKTSDELSTPTGKELAKEEIKEMVNNIFEGQRDVLRVSFGQFIIQ